MGTPTGLRLTRRGRRVLLGAVVLALVLVVSVAVRFVGWPDALLPGFLAGPPCTATTADGDRSLEVADARRLTSAALSGGGTAGLDPQDAQVVGALRSRDGALSCRLDADERRSRGGLAREPEGPDGLTARAEAVRTAIRAAAGELPLGGFAPGGVRTGHMPGSAHYEGRAIDVFFRPVSAKNGRHGWLLAQWLVAHAADLDIDNVIFDDRIWSASRGSSGWRPYIPPEGPTTNPVLRHLDHVHVDVVRGS